MAEAKHTEAARRPNKMEKLHEALHPDGAHEAQPVEERAPAEETPVLKMAVDPWRVPDGEADVAERALAERERAHKKIREYLGLPD